MATASSSSNFGDWPNEHGFESTIVQHEPIELNVTGHIPSWASGTLYRTGPGSRSVKADSGKILSTEHWFDGYNQLHRFQIAPAFPDKEASSVKIVYNSRFTVDTVLENARKTGKFRDISFGQKRDPCDSYFQKVKTIFQGAPSGAFDDGPSSRNVGVTVSLVLPGLGPATEQEQRRDSPVGFQHIPSRKSAPTIALKTDNTTSQMVHSETLKPLKIATQVSLHPLLKGPMSAAHAKTCPVTGDLFNYNLEFGRIGTYRVFRSSAVSGSTDIIATIHTLPTYLHSLFLTEHHVVLCVWNSHFVAGGLSVLWNMNIVDSLKELDTEEPATWYVIDRNGDGVIARYESDAFFAFHSVNAWEDITTRNRQQETDIVCEVVTYDNIDIIKRTYYANLLSNSPGAHAMKTNNPNHTRQKLRRYRLPSICSATTAVSRATVDHEIDYDSSPELPTINALFLTKPHRYTYGVVDRGRSTFVDGIVKVDMYTRRSIFWETFGHTPGEAIFIPRPNGTDEDDGVLLSVVFDGTGGSSYLLCLDARSMSELGRAEVGGIIGLGFHGAFVRADGKPLPAV